MGIQYLPRELGLGRRFRLLCTGRAKRMEYPMLWDTYFRPTTTQELLGLLEQFQSEARLVAGGTDVLVELRRGIRPTRTLIDVTGIDELRGLRVEGETLILGARVTHNDILASPLCRERALPLYQACLEVGAPAIRTRGTIVGNVVTASPANDTITPLLAMDAVVVLESKRGVRQLPLGAFYTGVRRTVLAPDEFVREIHVPLLTQHQRGLFLKLGLRRAQAIAVVNVAVVLTFEGATIAHAAIALGSVAPTVVRAAAAERFLIGRRLDQESIETAAELALQAAAPIDDVRGSAWYRRAMVVALVRQALERLAAGQERDGLPPRPVLLQLPVSRPSARPFAGIIETTVNGHPVALRHSTTVSLLDALRDELGLTGSKEGCAEGECGACTVWLDGQAVMSCLVPAPQAHGSEVITIEGLAKQRPTANGLHPLQESFVRFGAVQCGFCIPGMLMAGAMLLEEWSDPSPQEILTAISGNICRCTGYRKIVQAVTAAAGVKGPA